ncbi:MAG TPA: hypothetical protein VFE24_04775 [Pirellulales bacterium]|jgi:hypothetical protein|nr:hypothetical protein [Pirellulales bacterium]
MNKEMVTFNLRDERPGPLNVDLLVQKGSRFVATSFDRAEMMLVIQPDGRYCPQVFRIGFNKTDWKKMCELSAISSK